MSSADDPSSPRIMDVALEFSGSSHKKDSNNNNNTTNTTCGSSNSSTTSNNNNNNNNNVNSSNNTKPVVKKLAKSASSVRFIVQKLPSVVDAETADHVVAILLDELERLPIPGRIAKVQISNLRFTEHGALGLQGFLASHASTIRHVVLNNMIRSSTTTNNNTNNNNNNNNKKGKKQHHKDKDRDDHTDGGDSKENTRNEESSSLGRGDDDHGNSSSSSSDTDAQRVAQIITAFAHSPVTVLDLSRNRIHGSLLWKPWKQQQDDQQQQLLLQEQQQLQQGRNGNNGSNNSNGNGTTNNSTLKQLILDSVDMDHKSWITLASTFVWSGLDDLHVVIDDTLPSDEAVDAAQSILRNCSKLSSLRWIQKQGSDRPLPWTGLRDMAIARAAAAAAAAANGNNALMSSASSVSSTATNKHNPGASLKHLVLEGPGTPDFMTTRDLQDLTSTLKELTRLKTLKLRHLGLTDLATICSALRTARPPLEVIDFSYNEISSSGCRRLADLMRVSRIANQLIVLVMNDNRIETDAARDLLETFGTAITLDNNPGVDFTRIVSDLLTVKTGLERERDDLRLQLETRAYETGGENAEILKKENRRLREERDLLAKAFSVMGISQQVDEHRRLLDRIQRLEDMVVLGAVFKDGGVGVRTGSVHGGGGVGAGSVMGGLSGHDAAAALGSRNSSRRRINVNELPLDRLTQAAAAAAAAGRNSSGRSLSRSHSNRSTTSRSNNSMGTTGGGSGGEMDEVSMAVTESPHYSNNSRGGGGGSNAGTSSSNSARGGGMGRSSYARTTPSSPVGRNVVSPNSLHPMMMDRGGGVTDSTVMAAISGTDRSDRRTLSSSLRHSSYPNNPGTALGGRRGSSRMTDLE
ncbi:hypothetical protein ACA910_017836 [Epithemia clementina (nom. ined.)]